MILKRYVEVSLLIFLMIPILPVFKSVRADGTSTTIAVNPPESYVTVGKSFSVDINVTNVANLTSWQLTVYFLNSVLNCTNVVEGPFLKTGGGTYFGKTITNNYNSTHGRVLAYDTLLGNTTASGSGILATITFNALSVGDTTLHESDTKLGDENIPPQPIDHTTIDGTVHVQGFTLTVSTVGSGYVNLNNTGPYYHYEEVVTLTAVPIVGWSFQSWSGNLTGPTNPAFLVITGNMSVTATFTQDQYTLVVTVVGGGSVSENPSQATYVWGTNVTLAASASVGWSFAGWSGDASGSANPISVNMTSNKSVNATFTQTVYALTISVAGQGNVNLNDSGPYYYGDVVLLTAAAAVGWSFDHWSGDLGGSVNPTTILINGDKSVTATFTQIEYTLTVSAVGSGIVNLNNSGPYHYGDIILITAVPAIGWSFDHWSGNLIGIVNPANLFIIGNMSVTATFTQDQYTLVVTVVGGGSVSENPSQATYVWGTNVTLTANASVSWTFAGWSGDASGSVNPISVNMTSNKSVNATFTQITYTLTVNVVGQGSVTLNNTGPYHFGDAVLLTATAAVGWSFDHWSGDLGGSTNPGTLTITRNMTVNAQFTDTYTLTVDVGGSGSVNRNSTGPYHYGDVVRLTAVPAAGWFFDHWTGDLSGYANPATLTITGNKSVTAWFDKIIYTLKVSIVGNGCVIVNQTEPYCYGDVVQFTASASEGWTFFYWTGDLSGSDNPAVLVMTCGFPRPYYVTAYFVPKPTLQINPVNEICRTHGESFTLTLIVSDAVNVENFEFEIHYNTTLLDYLNVTWNAWGSGTISVDDANGIITGSTSGAPLNGTQNTVTIGFQAACYHVWKATPSWTNDLTDTIFLQRANLSYPGGSSLRYERGGALNQINVGPDFIYTFSPIQGDVNNDGVVDIFDLRPVGAYYNVQQGDPNWTAASTYDLNGDGIIDVTDLRLVAVNFGYVYIP